MRALIAVRVAGHVISVSRAAHGPPLAAFHGWRFQLIHWKNVSMGVSRIRRPTFSHAANRSSHSCTMLGMKRPAGFSKKRCLRCAYSSIRRMQVTP